VSIIFAVRFALAFSFPSAHEHAIFELLLPLSVPSSSPPLEPCSLLRAAARARAPAVAARPCLPCARDSETTANGRIHAGDGKLLEPRGGGAEDHGSAASPPSEPYATAIRAPVRPDGGLRARVGGWAEAVEAASAPRRRAPATASDGDVRGGRRGVAVPGHRSSPCVPVDPGAGGCCRDGGVDGKVVHVGGWAPDGAGNHRPQ
jgi:hypothetical protein